ncbi:hypothetical protein AX774_g952 [Zancudomyces culisetae]|uniref:60S ribosomal protein L34-B n=1 Tax=Zancudomyces culisetae TaxID=1213189 RepID=A0A1R1PX36_ZANCU|nr:hypothetical protein AX774_g952 [Zancudomyces culisetae]|eukprot:OMH85501.1 hypothetical protein AX774_g952 [Zancudomyces culisetae]
MFKSVLVSALLLGSTLASAVNMSGNQQNQNNDLANSEYKNNLSGCEFNDMHRHRRCRGRCKAKRTTVRLYKAAGFVNRYEKRSIRRGKCYNTRKFGSIKVGRKSGLDKPGKGVILVCGDKDCTGKCQIVRRSSAKTISNISEVVGRRAISFAWLRVKRT